MITSVHSDVSAPARERTQFSEFARETAQASNEARPQFGPRPFTVRRNNRSDAVACAKPDILSRKLSLPQCTFLDRVAMARR